LSIVSDDLFTIAVDSVPSSTVPFVSAPAGVTGPIISIEPYIPISNIIVFPLSSNNLNAYDGYEDKHSLPDPGPTRANLDIPKWDGIWLFKFGGECLGRVTHKWGITQLGPGFEPPGSIHMISPELGENDLVLINERGGVTAVNPLKDVLAKIYTSNAVDDVLIDRFWSIPKVYDNPFHEITTLQFEFRNQDGSLYDFLGFEHSFVLEIIEYEYIGIETVSTSIRQGIQDIDNNYRFELYD
jgi:hypothetical protein